MKSLVFDTGPLISLAMNNLVWILKPLKRKFKGKFYIPMYVKKELIDTPLKSKKFKFEAIRILKYIEDKTIEVIDIPEIERQSLELMKVANRCFYAHDHPIKVVHDGEIETIGAALFLKSNAIVVDERTTRSLIENPLFIQKVLQRKLHTKVEADKGQIKNLSKELKGLNVIRSVELAMIAYESGLLDKYMPDMKEPKKNLVDAVLWALKLYGCSVSKQEIDNIIRIEKNLGKI